jgi:hypothetical protein
MTNPTFSGISKERWEGIALLVENLMEIDAERKKQFSKDKPSKPVSDFSNPLESLTEEDWARIRREIDEEDIRRCTNSRGEIVPTVFPSND